VDLRPERPLEREGQIELVSVNVSKPKYLGEHRGHAITSGIAKVPVTAEHLWLDRLNLEGDGQADLEVHGGPDKAVYAYPSEHLPVWSEELGEILGPAAFGENLTTAGATEDDVCIGDRWYWGDAVLEVCQPRSPCFKLGMHRGRAAMVRWFRNSGRTGWYLRVLEPGRVPVAGPITVEPHPMGATVRVVWDAARPAGGVPLEVIDALLAVDPLALSWKLALAERLPG
jgi:MOSC domain-containing protein YiiM